MMPADIKAKLIADGLVTGYTVEEDTLPPTPDKAIGIFQTGGVAPLTLFGETAVIERPSVQIVVRGAPRDKATPELTMQRIFQAMNAWGAFTATGGARYQAFSAIQSPFPLTRDPQERVVFAVNFSVQKDPSPTT